MAKNQSRIGLMCGSVAMAGMCIGGLTVSPAQGQMFVAHTIAKVYDNKNGQYNEQKRTDDDAGWWSATAYSKATDFWDDSRTQAIASAGAGFDFHGLWWCENTDTVIDPTPEKPEDAYAWADASFTGSIVIEGLGFNVDLPVLPSIGVVTPAFGPECNQSTWFSISVDGFQVMSGSAMLDGTGGFTVGGDVFEGDFAVYYDDVNVCWIAEFVGAERMIAGMPVGVPINFECFSEVETVIDGVDVPLEVPYTLENRIDVMLPDEYAWMPVDLMQLEVSDLHAGTPGTFSLINGRPNEIAALAYSLRGMGSTYVPQLNVTLDLEKPKQAGPILRADADGYAQWDLMVPSAAAGMTVWFQAAQPSYTTPVVERLVFDETDSPVHRVRCPCGSTGHAAPSQTAGVTGTTPITPARARFQIRRSRMETVTADQTSP